MVQFVFQIEKGVFEIIKYTSDESNVLIMSNRLFVFVTVLIMIHQEQKKQQSLENKSNKFL